jgi:hypothetical protein
MSNANTLPEGELLCILLDKQGNAVIEIDTPVIVVHRIVNEESKFADLEGNEIGDARQAGYTLVPLVDIVNAMKKGNWIRYFQKA